MTNKPQVFIKEKKEKKSQSLNFKITQFTRQR